MGAYRTADRAFRAGLPPGTDLTEAVPRPPGRPLDAGRLAAELNRGGWEHRAPTLFVVNDAQRATPTAELLCLLDPPLSSWPSASVIVATGSHPPPGAGEMEKILGRDLLEAMRGRVTIHEAAAPGMAEAGRTSRGTRVRVNRALLGVEVLVAVGSVEPHYFAGYTGGRKSLVPGLAAFETIRDNHSLAMDPRAQPLRLADNPVHLDLEEACSLVLDTARPAGLREAVAVGAVSLGETVFALDRGPLAGAVERLAPSADALFTVPVPGAFPVVVAVAGPPLNRDFYQAMKAFEHGRRALAAGGVLVLVASCRLGAGPGHFRSLLARVPGGRPPAGEEEYELGRHKVRNLRDFLEGGQRLVLVSERALGELAPLGIRRFGRVEDGLAAACAEARGFSGDRRVLLLEEAGTLVPVPTAGEEGC